MVLLGIKTTEYLVSSYSTECDCVSGAVTCFLYVRESSSKAFIDFWENRLVNKQNHGFHSKKLNRERRSWSDNLQHLLGEF